MTFSKTITARPTNVSPDEELQYQAALALNRAGLLDRIDELKWSEKTQSGDCTQQFIWIP